MKLTSKTGASAGLCIDTESGALSGFGTPDNEKGPPFHSNSAAGASRHAATKKTLVQRAMGAMAQHSTGAFARPESAFWTCMRLP